MYFLTILHFKRTLFRTTRKTRKLWFTSLGLCGQRGLLRSWTCLCQVYLHKLLVEFIVVTLYTSYLCVGDQCLEIYWYLRILQQKGSGIPYSGKHIQFFIRNTEANSAPIKQHWWSENNLHCAELHGLVFTDLWAVITYKSIHRLPNYWVKS